MKKKNIFITIALACLMLLVFANSAIAATVGLNTQGGPTASNEIVITGEDYYKNPKTGTTYKLPVKQTLTSVDGVIQLASGTAGTVASSGYRNAWIKTTYSFLGTTTTSFKSKYYWRFSGGRVTYMKNNGREIWCRNGFFYKLIRSESGGPVKMTWNRIWGGQQKCWQSATIRASGPIVGEIYEYRPYHEMYARGNGTYYWRATP